MFDHGVSMSFTLDFLKIKCRISLMSRSELMMTNYFVVRDLLPFRSSDVMLRVDEWITDETDMAHDPNELVGGHGVPFVAVHLRVIHLDVLGQWMFFGRMTACRHAQD